MIFLVYILCNGCSSNLGIALQRPDAAAPNGNSTGLNSSTSNRELWSQQNKRAEVSFIKYYGEYFVLECKIYGLWRKGMVIPRSISISWLLLNCAGYISRWPPCILLDQGMRYEWLIFYRWTADTRAIGKDIIHCSIYASTIQIQTNTNYHRWTTTKRRNNKRWKKHLANAPTISLEYTISINLEKPSHAWSGKAWSNSRKKKILSVW